MQTVIFAILSLPLLAFAAPAEAGASKVAVRAPNVEHTANFFKMKLGKRDDLCPYEKCLDECISWGAVAPCNPMDLCDPGLGCSLGCAVACA